MKTYQAGIDVGSTTVKLVVLDENGQMIFGQYQRHLSHTQRALSDLLKQARAALGECALELRATGSGAINLAKALGIPFRYIPFTSDLDGKTGEVVRVHHHIIVNAEAAEIALEKWSAGSTHREHLYDQVDQTPLAHYLLAQVRHRPNEKKYSPSRNLIVPQPKDRIAVSGAELQVPRGGQLLLRAGWMPGMPQYIRYIVPEVGKIRRGEAPPEKTRE